VNAAASSASALPPERPELHGLQRALTAQNLWSRFVPSQGAPGCFSSLIRFGALYRRRRSNLPEQRTLAGDVVGTSIARAARTQRRSVPASHEARALANRDTRRTYR
jgi:hypothetical protein